ncbi:unnamed protein product, partial [Discosporangium mesarthrocarpum]
MSEKDPKKKSRKERQRELRMLEKEISGVKSLVDYGKVNQRHMDDNRFERELKNKEDLQKQAVTGTNKDADQAPSATYDAFMRLQTGQQERTIKDKINDPHRVSWEQFRKDNEDRLNIPGADQKKMILYRKQLDAEREAALAKGRNRPKRKLGVSDSEDEDEENGEGSKEGGGGEENGGMGKGGKGGGEEGEKKKRSKSHRKKEKKSKKDKKRKHKHKSSKHSKKSSRR